MVLASRALRRRCAPLATLRAYLQEIFIGKAPLGTYYNHSPQPYNRLTVAGEERKTASQSFTRRQSRYRMRQTKNTRTKRGLPFVRGNSNIT